VRPKSSERGAALLTVLMLVAVIGVIAAASLDRLTLATRASINLIALSQARAYGLAAETIATSRIADLLANDSKKTTLAGDWMGRAVPFPIDGGTATAKLIDGGNCFNLNSLATGNFETGLTANPIAIGQFEGLMTLVGIPQNNARSLSQATADWIDSDNAPLPGGAEDGAYTPSLAANTLMVDASELHIIAGMTGDHYRLIRPWVCALPTAGLSPINVNTLTPGQAPLIAMLVPNKLSVQTAKQMIDERPVSGYATAVDFWKLPALTGLTPAAEVMAQTQVRTRWFGLDVSIALAGAEHRQVSLIDGENPPPRVVSRSYGDPQ
jgi:general secretion pathway protein K